MATHKPPDDPLDGFRGRPGLSQEEMLEQQVLGLRSLGEAGIDVHLIRDVMDGDELIKAMKDDKVIGRLVTHVVKTLDEATKIWWDAPSSNTSQAIAAHLDARACRVLLDWIQDQLQTSATAEQMLNEAEEREHYEEPED